MMIASDYRARSIFIKSEDTLQNLLFIVMIDQRNGNLTQLLSYIFLLFQFYANDIEKKYSMRCGPFYIMRLIYSN